MKKKRERRIAMLLAMMMLIMNLIVSPVWAAPGVAIDETNFPDKNFRDYVLTLDGDHDGKLSGWEIARVTSIDVRYKSIADLTGIGYFTALLKLDCAYTQLSTLDTGKNTALQELNCYKSQLKSLDIRKNTALQKLECSENQLTSLDISKNTALKELYCAANKLTSLDVSKNTALENLYCSRNQLTSLDVSKNTTLKELDCAENQLTSLDISKNPALVTLACSMNQLTNLDLSENPALVNLFCTRNHLTNLDLSKNTALVNLFCYNQTYDVKVKISDMKIPYADFPGSFDITKATRIVGANSDFIVDATKPSIVTYNYKTGYNPKYFNVTLNITYDAYTVTFNTNGGSAVSPQIIKTGEHATIPTAPTKDGYTFAGWYKDAGLTTPFNFATETINADITLYAKWTQNAPTSYTVTFNTNGGTAINPQTITAGEHVTKPEDPTKDGYTFDGWYKDAEFTTAFDFVKETINADTTIYAKWTQNAPPTPVTYTLTASVDGGHGSVTPTNATKNKNETVTLTFTPETGYEIDEVKVNNVVTPVSGNTLTLTMDGDKTVVVKYKATPTPPPTPVTYTLTASVDGGHGSVTPTSKTVNKDETVTLTFTPETGYEIDEVKVNDVATTVSGNTLTLTMDRDKTVVVKYKATPTPPIVTPVTITFDKNGGSGTMADVTKNKGESFTLPACGFTPPAGKEFKAWQVDGTEKNVGDNIVLNGDKTIKAVWKDIGSVPPTPPVPPTPYTPYPWIVYPGWYYNFETPKPKEEKPVTKMEIDWKLELIVGVSTINREINGVQSKIKMDVAPYIRDGRTMLPIRYVAEALGFDVEWIKSTRTVVLKNNSTRVEIPVDTNKIIVNGTVYTSDVKPEIKNNRTMLPIANIARALGLKDGKDIIWNSKSKMVTIYRSIVVK